MKVSILGTGKMGSAVGRQLAAAGWDIVYGSRDPDANKGKYAEFENITVTTYPDAAAASDTVLIAVPWAYALDLLQTLANPLKGKIVVDMTNPLSPDISYLVVGGADSAAERVSAQLPESQVVKAFNAITADNFPTPSASGEPAQVFYCSDHDEAKQAARQLIEATGYVPKDCGALSNARYVEAMAMLWLQLAFWEDKGSEWAFKIVEK